MTSKPVKRMDGEPGGAIDASHPRPIRLAPRQPLPTLPDSLTSFIGREDIVGDVSGLLRQPETRLLTLTGPGGVGKTRLALKVADTVRPDFADGVGFIALAAVNEPALVLSAIAHRLGVQEGDRWSLTERLGAYLAGRQCLLVIDNFEQIAAAGPVLTQMLSACPHLTLLVTSRVPLRVSGEQVFSVTPMALPAPGTGAEVVDSEAVRLFVARAEAVRPGVTLTESTTPAIAEICTRLDGLPLAIELAAARSSLLSPPVMLARLDQRLPLLTSGPRDQPERLQTMANAIAWSYHLLTDDEQVFFRRLGVFVGGFSLAAAVAINDEREDAVVAGMEALVDHSLVRAVADGTDELRFTLLETIREFSFDQLAAASEADGALERHAKHFVDLAERIEPEVDGPEAVVSLAMLDLNRANLQAALAWLIENQETEDALRLAASLWRYWRIRGDLSEGRDGLEQALSLPGPALPLIRADALWKLGYLHFFVGDCGAAQSCLERSVELFIEAGDRAGEATARDSLGTILLHQGEPEQAKSSHERAFIIRQELGDRFEVGITLANLGRIALHRGELGEARTLLEEALTIARESGSRREFGHRCLNLSQVEIAEENLTVAQELVEQALAIFKELGEQVAIADALEVLGQIASELGERQVGIGFLTASLQFRLKLGLHRNLAECVERLASAAVSLDPALATRLLATADADRETTGIDRLPWDATTWNRSVGMAKTALGDARFDEAWRAGERMTMVAAGREAEAAFTALAPPEVTLTTSTETTLQPGFPTPDLTPRELEILRLVAAGHTNRAIAATLFISPATVKRHVTNILSKLQLPTRAAAISYALRAGLLDG